jgi:lipoprotein NlpD
MNVPVHDLGSQSKYRSKYAPATHIVLKGDTLFSIALRYDLDYKRLALANNIHPPYIIRPNDVIYLKEYSGTIYTPNKVTPPVYPRNNPVVVSQAKNTGVISEKGVKQKQEQRLPKVKNKTASNVDSDASWIWPVSGALLKQFSAKNSLSKGIDIGAAEGTPIKAARSGEVVYAGSGLKGYGNLIIIRHDEVYISAYAHNKSILVKEGQMIKRGDKIAELGMSGTQSPKLHFEIREHGKPINPLVLLPK